jgi:hypothetical protein
MNGVTASDPVCTAVAEAVSPPTTAYLTSLVVQRIDILVTSSDNVVEALVLVVVIV